MLNNPASLRAGIIFEFIFRKMIKQFSISTSKKEELIDITAEVEKTIADSKIKNGICFLYVPHATAALTINENADPNVADDIIKALQKAVPEGSWKHDRIDGNATAHIKSTIMGSSETIPIENGKLALGTWQDIFFCEFDGPRSNRKIIVQIIKD